MLTALHDGAFLSRVRSVEAADIDFMSLANGLDRTLEAFPCIRVRIEHTGTSRAITDPKTVFDHERETKHIEHRHIAMSREDVL